MDMMPEPGPEHRWLHRMIGEWTSEATMEIVPGEIVPGEMAPGQAPETCRDTESVRSLGGLWVVAEGRGEMPGGGEVSTIMTLGHDPAKGRFVGSFVASMMTHLWRYEGTLDEAGQVLTLDTEGPDCEGGMARFQDVIAFEGDDHRTLTSRRRNDEGQWQTFMTAHYRRA